MVEPFASLSFLTAFSRGLPYNGRQCWMSSNAGQMKRDGLLPNKKSPRPGSRGRGSGRAMACSYFPPRLEAFNGLIFCLFAAAAATTWVAMLQLPRFHLSAGSGQAEQ